MGNVFGMSPPSDIEQDVRIANIERRVLELEEKVFLGRPVENNRTVKQFGYDPPVTMYSNPMITSISNAPNSSAPLFTKPKNLPGPPDSMSWSR